MSENKRWIKSDEENTCVRCGEVTELLVDDSHEYAERCGKCGWRINFDDNDRLREIR